MRPQLCVPVEQTVISQLAADESWTFTQKVDGKRLVTVGEDGSVSSYNRAGRKIKTPDAIARKLGRLSEGRFVLDGELMQDGTYWLFDAPFVAPGGTKLIGFESTYADRMKVLTGLVKFLWPSDNVMRVLPYASAPEHKMRLLGWVQDNHGEGIVARQMDAPYQPGKRSTGAVKIKFVKSADCFVESIGEDGKANLVLAVYDDKGNVVKVGKVARFVGDGPKARVGQVLDVQYLSFSKAGRMLQATNPRRRTDKGARQCLLDQFFPVDMKMIGVG